MARKYLGHGARRPCLTKGNPKNVDITLSYRPDLLKGAVTGQITGVGIDLTPTSYAMAILIDPTTGDTLGIDAQNVVDGLPVAFSVPYALTDIQPTQDYVVTAEVGDDGQLWRNAAGVPVITNGNPKTAIQVVVTPVLVASPSSSPSASPSPSPTPAPSAAPSGSRGLGSGNLLWIIILIATSSGPSSRSSSPAGGPTPPPTGAAAGAAGAAGAGGAAGAAEGDPPPKREPKREQKRRPKRELKPLRPSRPGATPA